MTHRVLRLPGLPDSVEVRASSRRRRTVSAYREAGRTIVLVPERMTRDQIVAYVVELVARLDGREARSVTSDARLLSRAQDLNAEFLGGAATAGSVRWVGNQHHRWGSCTPTDAAIRLSSRLQPMPEYVRDYVLLHELCHLLVADHGPKFHRLMASYPQLAQAQSFLAGYELARLHVEPPDAGQPGRSIDLTDDVPLIGNDPITTSGHAAKSVCVRAT